MELSLEILLGDFKIVQGHPRALVTESLHDGGKANTGTEHFTGVGVAKLVRDDAGGDSGRGDNMLQSRAEFANQHVATARPR